MLSSSGPRVTSWPTLYLSHMENTAKDITQLIKLWLDENNTSGFWQIEVKPNSEWDSIYMTHTYEAMGTLSGNSEVSNTTIHDNYMLEVVISLPHDFTSKQYRWCNLSNIDNPAFDDTKISVGDPNFFQYLRGRIDTCISLQMQLLYKKLETGSRYRGVYVQ